MRKTQKYESNNADVRDGLTRSSVEGSVMELEQRSQLGNVNQHQQRWKNADEHQKTFEVSMEAIQNAWQKVRAKGGIGGVDGESIKRFEQNLERNLYKLWNRMSSGSYYPKAVMRVEIPKGDGKKRPLGIPTITDRVAQEVVRARLEGKVEKLFHPDSYGYRPNKSAVNAVRVCRERCWKYDWVLDVDIQKFFDTIDHKLMMKAVEYLKPEKWESLYIERWLKAPVQHKDGSIEETKMGTPQGGVISPLLANLYLHFAFDNWLRREYPKAQFERYADDIVIHCESKEESEEIESALAKRLQECKLSLHPEKTKVVHCKDGARKGKYPTKKFTFLGYSFQPRQAQNTKIGKTFTRFLPAVSADAEKKFRESIKARKYFKIDQLTLEELAAQVNPRIRGWYEYFRHFYQSALSRMSDWLNMAIVKWLKKKFRFNWNESFSKFKMLVKQDPKRFFHWQFRFPRRAV
jgi:group II intron reverse transcriptase/maturase